MPITSAAGLVEAVRRFGLLPPTQAAELTGLQPRFPDARALAKELLQRGWLTPYQINHLVAGNGYSLVLGQYVLLERIGEGGMGQVLKARHQRLERIVALKLIRKERLTGRDAVQRFQREARAAARLSHPNLVTVYDADEVGGTHFFAMEYVEGTDLSKLVRKQGMLGVREACEYVRQAALGLQHAHEQRLVHRDIKPANLMLTTKGAVKVLDLGLARLATAADNGDPTDPMTHEGAVMGTPDYMAPEQATDSHTADIRADLYSLGCTLFHLLTGKAPYSGGTLTEKLLKHQMDPLPRAEVVRTDMPPELAAVVRRLLAKKPAERYQTPAELAAALAPFCGSRPPVAIPVSETVAYTPEDQSHQNTQTDGLTVGGRKPLAVPIVQPRWSKRLTDRRSLVGIGSGLLLLLIVLLVVLWLRGARPGQAGDDPGSSTWPLDRLTPGSIQSLKEFDGTPPAALVLTLRHDATVNLVALSDDGRYAVSGGADKMLRLWDLASDPPGHEERCFGEYRGASNVGPAELTDTVRFSPDGRRILSLGHIDQEPGWRASLWDVPTGNELNRTEGIIGDATFASDKVTPLVVRWREGKDELEFYDFVKSKDVQPPVPGLGVMWYWSLSPSERYLAGQTGAAGKGVALCQLAPARRIATFELDSGKVASRVVFSRDSKHLCWGCSDGLVRMWDVDSAASQPATILDTLSTKAVASVAFSQDGSMIAASSVDGRVTIYDAKTRTSLRKWTMPGAVSCVTFDAKGRHLATANANGSVYILRLPE